MKLKVLSALALSCSLATGAVTFSNVDQTLDGSLHPSSTLESIGPTGTGSRQTVTGDVVSEGVGYDSFNISLDLVGGMGSPTQGNSSVSLEFTADTAHPYTTNAESLFEIGVGPAAASGTLNPGSVYVLNTDVSGNASSTNSTTFQFNVIPEPSTGLLGLLGIVGLLRRRR